MNSKQLREAIENTLVEHITDHGVRKTDEFENLECFCSDNPPANDFGRQIRGCVFDGNDLVLKSLAYPIECTAFENLKGGVFTLMREGTVIRVFNYKGKWMTTTHRKLNAFKSKWNNESFGDIFQLFVKEHTGFESLDEFYGTLDASKVYMFIIGTTEKTRMISPAESFIQLIGVYDPNNNWEKISVPENVKCFEINAIANVDETNVFEYVSNLKYPFGDGIGVFVTMPDGTSYKVTNEEYAKLFGYRNNLPSVMFAYLHNVFESDRKAIFRRLYPAHISDFDAYDKEIIEIAKCIQQKYYLKFVTKQQVETTPSEYMVMYKVHGNYINNRLPVKTSSVYSVLSEMSPTVINKIMKERKQKKYNEAKQLLEQQKQN
jgi:hypothetical protein